MSVSPPHSQSKVDLSESKNLQLRNLYSYSRRRISSETVKLCGVTPSDVESVHDEVEVGTRRYNVMHSVCQCK